MKNCVPMISEPAPKWPTASPSAGAKVLSLVGRLHRERERLAGCGMTDEERSWRAQWVRDQRLSRHEPVKVPKIYEELNNPIKRFYRRPMDKVEQRLIPKLGENNAKLVRMVAGKMGLVIVGVYAASYYFKYNANDWTRKGGWRVIPNRRSVVPGDTGWPYQPEKTQWSDYAHRGFKNSPIQESLTTPASTTSESTNLTAPSDTQPAPDDLVSPDPDGPGEVGDALQEANLSSETFERSEKVEV